MVSKESRTKVRENKHRKLRKRYFGTESCPRLCVYRSLNNIYANLINDETATTIASASTYISLSQFSNLVK